MIAFLIGGLLWIAMASGSSGSFAPWTLNDLHLGPPPPACEEGVPENSLEVSEKGRAANFSTTGTYFCRHPIFDYGERDPFIDFVAANAPIRAKRVAQALQSEELKSQLPLTLEIQAESSSVAGIVRSAFATELTMSLGPGSIARGERSLTAATTTAVAADTAHTAPSQLVVKVNRVSLAEALFEIHLKVIDVQGESRWRKL